MARSATIPNSDIEFRREGAGSRAIVFVHGFLDDQHVWNPVIAELTASEFETVQLDLAGSGDRTEASGPFTYDRFAADLCAVVDALDKPFVLVGHSMAAPVVELVAAARPDRAMGLVLLSPIPMAGTRLPDEAIETFRSLGALGAPELRAARRQTAPSAPEVEVDRLATVAAKGRPEVVRTEADLWNNGHPAGGRPSGFSGPVLVLPGADDPLITAAVVASGVGARFDSDNTTVTEIEKSGHWPHIERPSAVATEIDRFLIGNFAVGKHS
ncbi:alpha/beta fold hydrolase [Streptomyces sp. S1D4-11]|nr:alpha/beta hydrolase [Streptomyces sp. S1D4-11]QIZ01079.1 alpha/beta hydrolase [Streptomyces sp. S1D4-11]